MNIAAQSHIRRRSLLTVAAAVALPAMAATWPERPIRLVVPFAAGGLGDISARLLAQSLSTSLGTPVLVDNKPGANGIIGTDVVAKAAPDGYTLLMTVRSAQTFAPVVYKTPYDSVKDLTPISILGDIDNIMIVHPSVKANTVQELIALAKAEPGRMNYAAGTSLVHLAMEVFKHLTGTSIVSVPYKGAGPALEAVLKGEVAMTFDPFSALPHLRAGKLKCLAVLSDRRSTVLPDVPTLREAGVSGLTLESWLGLMAPAGTPPDIIKRLHAAAVTMVQTPAVRERFAAMNVHPVGNTPEQFAQIVVSDTARWAQYVKTLNFKAE